MNLRFAELSENDMAARPNFLVIQIAEVLAALGGGDRVVRKNYLWEALENPNTSIQVAFDDDKDIMVGMVVANALPMPDDIEGRIDDVAVRSEYRKHGIARTLLARAHEFLRGRGATEVELTCAPHRVEAGKLYESDGYEQRATRVYTRSLAPATESVG